MSTTVVDIAAGSTDFETLTAAVIAAGLDDDLAGAGPFTVLAPNDDAFDRLPAGLVTELTTNQIPLLTTILQYHVVPLEADEATVRTLDSAPTLLGDMAPNLVDIAVEPGSNTVVLNGTVQVIDTDITADNGIVHALDGVLMPGNDFPGTIVDALSAYPRFSTLVGAVASAAPTGGAAGDLVTTLNGAGPFTVFAPTNAAFAAIQSTVDGLTPQQLADILLYHVVAGDVDSGTVVGLAAAETANGAPITISVDSGVVSINGTATVTYTDITTTNGRIHVIDAVITPPADDIPATAIGVPNEFDTLVAALTAADLVDDLSLPNGPFTVFAPTDAAFGALPAGVVTDLTTNNIPLLTAILQHHVIGATVDSSTVVGLTSGDTLNGPISIAVDDGTVVLNGTAQVSATDTPTANGLIHIVDGVIIPQDAAFPGNAVDALSAYPRFSSLVAAVLDAANTDDTLVPAITDDQNPVTIFAPTNNAFAALSAAPTGQALVDVLRYHVVAGAVDANTVMGLTSANSVDGDPIAIDTSSGVVLNGSVNVTYTDIEVSNGIIHVIDAVLIPPMN